jgi:hypothetical protein
MRGRSIRVSRLPSSVETMLQSVQAFGGFTSRQPLSIRFPPGSPVQYDRAASLPPEASALEKLRAKQRTGYRGLVIASSDHDVEVIWENGRHAIYGFAKWYGRIECLQPVR